VNQRGMSNRMNVRNAHSLCPRPLVPMSSRPKNIRDVPFNAE
jgi:hypothetical protein